MGTPTERCCSYHLAELQRQSTTFSTSPARTPARTGLRWRAEGDPSVSEERVPLWQWPICESSSRSIEVETYPPITRKTHKTSRNKTMNRGRDGCCQPPPAQIRT